MFVILVVIAVTISTMSICAFAADTAMIKNRDNSELGKQNITVYIGTQSFPFYGSNGGNKWTSTDSFLELGLGRGESISVIIIDQDNNEYTALLSNQGNGKGNNKDSENGTDHYELSNITPNIPSNPSDEQPPVDDGSDELPPVDDGSDELLIIEIVEEPVPLAATPEEMPAFVEIPEESVPLAAVPVTGDNMGLWLALSATALAGMIALALTEKKKVVSQ